MNTTNPNETANPLVREVYANTMDGNNILTAAKVSPMFQGHHFDADKGQHGITDLIISILTDAKAVFPLGSENTDFRPVVIKASLFVNDIAEQVQARFAAGSTRYPLQSVKQYVSVYLFKRGIVAKFALKGYEDSGRTSNKARSKYYLVQK